MNSRGRARTMELQRSMLEHSHAINVVTTNNWLVSQTDANIILSKQENKSDNDRIRS